MKKNALLSTQPRQENREAKTEQPARKTDTVSISLQARKRLAELADSSRPLAPEQANTESDGDATRLDLIRARIADGFYSREDVRAMIADKLTGHLGEE
ncbi:MAG: hypothetical protein P1R58_00950 [bacterium]|nr:hypothetical protein [bacterium]